MATRWQRCAQLLSSHPYHSAISSAPSFSLGARDDDGTGGGGDHGAAGAAAGNFAPQDSGVGALASPRPAAELPRGAVSATDRFFVSPARTASLVDDGAGEALRGAVPVEAYSSDPRGQFLESMAEMAAAYGAEGMPAPEYREFMEELLSCYLERNDRGVHPHVLAAYADLTARRWPSKRRRPLRGLMKISPCVSGS
ncbi:hypothetical protein PAHAL_5G498700 [Panicum hallii]|jgi:uncharacterized protein (TIGR01568 family)|uniref:Transcription repressor n=1 Tax=Panicum hallii TaxID=206008 RepID=A0A2S3HYC0_9POAL|nr:hypothetical protein PAHAL_5G498700 [Panicum hallii]